MTTGEKKIAVNQASIKKFLELRKIYSESTYSCNTFCMVRYKHGHYTSTEVMEVTILLVKDKYGNIKLEGSKTYDEDINPLNFSAKKATYKYEGDKFIIYSTRAKEKVVIEIGSNSAFPDDSI